MQIIWQELVQITSDELHLDAVLIKLLFVLYLYLYYQLNTTSG